MAMKPFLDSEELRLSLGLMDHENVITSLDRAIIATQIYFEELLQTRLMRQSNVDNFCIDPKVIYVVCDGFYRLRLRNAHVRSDVPLTVTRYDTYPDLMRNSNPMVLDPLQGDYFVNAEKGVVHVNQEAATAVGVFLNYVNTPKYNYFFKVTYDSGYVGKADASEAIKAAITSYVPVLLNQQQVFNRAEEQANYFNTGKEHAFTLLAPYMRDVGFCFRALG